MKIYVGATFSRYLEARSVIDALVAAGHDVTHDWTRTAAFGADGHPLPDSGDGYELPAEEQAAHALDDLAAVKGADLLLILAEQASCGWPVEVGAALAWGKAEVWLVAPFRPTVFWCLPQVSVFESVAQPLRELGATP
ncbi:MAG TPA: hypothetical protein VMS60_15955 [Solirubrobacterales bacterium]|nr:hypothetical protein [Solirubrobacterales bacterium]